MSRQRDKRKKDQRRQKTASTRMSQNSSLPGNFVRALERWERLLSTLGEFNDLADAIKERHARLEELLAPVDAIELLGQLVLSELPTSADSYVESEHPGAAYVLEIAAAVLARRSSRRGTSRPGRVVDASILDPTREMVGEIALLEGLRRHHGARAPAADDPIRAAQARAALAHMMVRGPGWPWQEADALRDLFSPFSSRLREAIGFDAADAVACSEAATALIPHQLQQHSKDAQSHLDDALAWAKSALGGWQDQPAEPFRDRALTALWALVKVGDAMLVTPERLAAQASVDVGHARAYLERLSTKFGLDEPLFRAAERIRFAPYLRLEHDSYFLTVPGNDLWALRPAFEQTLKGEAYSRHRGRWLEQRAIALLTRPLNPDEVYAGVKIIDKAAQTELGEIDGLVRLGDTVLIVEAKAATMRPGARRGGAALEKHLKETLKTASEQAALASDVLQGRRPASLRRADGEDLELGEPIREVHPILVTLDDLSAVAPVVWELAGSAVLPQGTTSPWTITLHELDLVCQTVESPIQLVHFLRRRRGSTSLVGASRTTSWTGGCSISTAGSTSRARRRQVLFATSRRRTNSTRGCCMTASYVVALRPSRVSG